MTIRILLAEDHRILREGLRSLIENEPDMEVVAEAQDGREAVELAVKHSPQVVVMDLSMPKLNGDEATRQILKKKPNTKVLALSMHPSKQYVLSMLKAGAKGYLVKSCAYGELNRAIKTVVSNHIYLSERINDSVVLDYMSNRNEGESEMFPELTSREVEVLKLLAEGQTPKKIAVDLNISPKTVASHREHIYAKLGTDNLADLTVIALQRGLITLEDKSRFESKSVP